MDAVMVKYSENDAHHEKKIAGITNYFLDQFEMRPELVHVFITQISRSTENLTPERLSGFKRFMTQVEGIMEQGQNDGFLRDDIKARYLTYVFLGSVETFLSAMVLENQTLKGRKQKKRIADAILNLFLNGARPSK